VTSDFHREVDENCAHVGYYGYTSSNFLPTSKPETSVRNYDHSLRNNPEERNSQFIWELNANKR